jgi:hypothetical protein
MDDGIRVGWYEAFALLAGFALFAMASANRLTFPFPWNDEARFYLPALWLVKYGSLDPAILNAPRGIYWVPDGFTVFLALVLRLFGQTIEIARTTCECIVAAGVAIFALAFRKLSGSWKTGALATLLLLTPPVVFAANMVRMEAPLFLLIAVALLLHVNGYPLGACGLLFGSLLFHPALGLAAVGYAVLSWAFHERKGHSRRSRTMEWAVLAVVLLCLLSEGLRIAHNADLFKAHMAYQVSRKMGRPLIARLIKPQGVILFICSAATAMIIVRRWAWERRSSNQFVLGAATVALGVLTFAVLGAELQYDVYSLSVAPAIIFCLTVNEFRESSTGMVLDPAELVVGSVQSKETFEHLGTPRSRLR